MIVSIRCPRCGAIITQRGVSHSGPGSQWECRCGYIEQDRGQGTAATLDQYGTDDRGKQQQDHPSSAPPGW